MNKERLLELADAIEQAPHLAVNSIEHRYNHIRAAQIDGSLPNYYCQGVWLVDVLGRGSCGCVAGWAVALWGDDEALTVWASAVKALDLTQAEAERLFYGDGNPYNTTPAEAANAIRRLTEGKDPWEIWNE